MFIYTKKDVFMTLLYNILLVFVKHAFFILLRLPNLQWMGVSLVSFFPLHVLSERLNPLSANPTKWSNALEQFVGNSVWRVQVARSWCVFKRYYIVLFWENKTTVSTPPTNYEPPKLEDYSEISTSSHFQIIRHGRVFWKLLVSCNIEINLSFRWKKRWLHYPSMTSPSNRLILVHFGSSTGFSLISFGFSLNKLTL